MRTLYRIRLEILICLFLVLATFAVYWQVREFSFVNYDDDSYVTDNPHVRDGLTFENVEWAFSTGYASNWFPMTWLSHMLDCQLYGLDPAGHHLTSVVLHILNSVLLFCAFRTMAGDVWQSGFAAALFALHPLHVESVAWVAERKDVLSTLFWMLTIWSYANYVTCKGKGAYLLTLVLFALGLMAKPMLVTLPFVLLLLDLWPLRRMSATPRTGSGDGLRKGSTLLSLILEKWPFLMLAAASSTATFIAQRSGGAVRSLEEWPLDVRIGNALVSYVAYLGRALVPRDLAVFYPHTGAPPTLQVALACVLLVVVSLVVIRAWKKQPYLAVGWFWYLGTLVPVIGLVQVGAQAMADRYTYVPLIGVFTMVGWGVPALTRGWRFHRTGLATAAAVVLPVLMVSAHMQVRYWENSVTLFEHALEATANNYIAHNNLGMALAKEGRHAEAAQQYRLAVEVNPNFAKAHFNLGAASYEAGRAAEAVVHYLRALQLDPDWREAHYNVGIALASVGELDEAVRHYLEAIRIDPHDARSLNNLANVLVKQGKMDEAIRRFSEALQADPDDAAAHNNLGATLASQRRFGEAILHFRRALELEPGDVHASTNLDRAMAHEARAR
jgi:tetratricopeptide (TPR) repeat protein